MCKAEQGLPFPWPREFSLSNHWLLLLLIAFRGKTAHNWWSTIGFLCNNSILVIWQMIQCISVFVLWRVSKVSIYNVFFFTSLSNAANHRHICWFLECNGQSEVFRLESTNPGPYVALPLPCRIPHLFLIWKRK